jgi:hypothetical protein
VLVDGQGQSLDYVACGNEATTQRYLVTPNSIAASATSLSSNTALSPSTALSSNTALTSSSPAPSPTNTGNTPVPSTYKSTETGPIVGGVIGGLAIVCLTIFGVFFVRRKRSNTYEKSEPPASTPKPTSSEYIDLPQLDLQKYALVEAGSGPDEMRELHGGERSPVELPGAESVKAPARKD